MKYEFIVNEKEKSFSFAGVEFTNYNMISKASDACYTMMEQGAPIKSSYDAFIEKFDIPPKTFAKVHNGIMTRLWLDPVRKYSKYLAFAGVSKKPMPSRLKKVHDTLPILQQAEDDGIRNIIPILFLYGKTPKEVKSIVGKSTWKALCKNSFTRNLHIMKLVLAYNLNSSETYYDIDTSLDVINQFPSGVLKKGGNSPVSFTPAGWWAYSYRTLLGVKNKRDFRGLENTFIDTKRMSVQVGKPFKEGWSRTKMVSKHEEYTNLINLRKYSLEPFETLEKVKCKTFKSKNYEATLLNSALSIRNEGDTMKHCVGSYSSDVSDGRYLVYSITKEGKQSSTLGINIKKELDSKGKEYTFSQHYKHCNQRVTCLEEQKLAQDILSILNRGENNV